MERDIDYLRKILLEARDSNDDLIYVINHLGMSADEIKRSHHIQILCDDGRLVQVSEQAFRLSSQGHDFIECVSNDSKWGAIKKAWSTHGWKAILAILAILFRSF